jgi:hypothetical protein
LIMGEIKPSFWKFNKARITPDNSELFKHRLC